MSKTADETENQRPGTMHPRLARERALKVLFAADVRRVDARKLLDEVETHEQDLQLLDELEPDREQVEDDEELQRELTRRQRLPLDDYTRLLVDGVASRQPQIDDLLGEVADNWQVHRMPSVDRNLLRLGIYELAEQDTPHAVVIDEAVSLAVAFAGEKAQSFVNGVLEAVRKQVVAGEVDLTPPPAPTPDTPPAPTPDTPSVSEPDESAPAMDDSSAVTDDERERSEVDAADERTTEQQGMTDEPAEVDTAAQEAYDLALDLLEAEGPLDERQFDDSPQAEQSDRDGAAEELALDDAADDDVDEVAEQGQAASDLDDLDLDGARFDADIEFVDVEDEPVDGDDRDEVADGEPADDEPSVNDDAAGHDEDRAGGGELRDAGDALW